MKTPAPKSGCALDALVRHLVLRALAVALHLVELQHAHRHVLVAVRRLLRALVDPLLLLLLLTTVNRGKSVDRGALLHLAEERRLSLQETRGAAQRHAVGDTGGGAH